MGVELEVDDGGEDGVQAVDDGGEDCVQAVDHSVWISHQMCVKSLLTYKPILVNVWWCFRCILEASYELHDVVFFQNLGTILLYAVIVSDCVLLSVHCILLLSLQNILSAHELNQFAPITFHFGRLLLWHILLYTYWTIKSVTFYF